MLDAPAFTQLVEHLRAADGAYINFEMVTPRLPAIPENASKAIRLAGPEWVLDELTWMGFDLFGLANNHAYDFTFVGLADTIEALERRDISFSGVGPTLETARKPCYIDTSQGRVALVSVGSTAATTSLAADPGPMTAGRTGINPLRFEVEYQLADSHFNALVALDESLGTAAPTAALLSTGVFPAPRIADPANERLFLGRRFTRRSGSGVVTRPNARDLSQINRWVSEARRSADIVAIGLHAHESTGDGINLDPPAGFIAQAAHAFVDAGADIVFGHGPHRLRGVEIYDGKPIFYSLGNFMFMDETFEVFDPAQYDVFGIGPDPTPADLHDYREFDADGAPKGFHMDSAFWEGAVAGCEFDGERLISVDLTPIALQKTPSRAGRGIPFVARGAHGVGILERIASLSEEYGTTFQIDANDEAPSSRVVLD